MRINTDWFWGGIFVGGWLFACTTVAAQTTYRVDVNAPVGVNDGSTWCQAFLNV